jgi:hypothetical protein
VTLTGNSFASAYDRSLVLENCRHVIVGTNAFDHNPDYKGPRVDGIRVVHSSGVNLQNLILEGCRAGGPEEGGAIEVVDSSEVLVLGCQVLDPEFRGVDIRNCRNTKVVECTIVDRRAEPTMREPIRTVDRDGQPLSADLAALA